MLSLAPMGVFSPYFRHNLSERLGRVKGNALGSSPFLTPPADALSQPLGYSISEAHGFTSRAQGSFSAKSCNVTSLLKRSVLMLFIIEFNGSNNSQGILKTPIIPFL